MQTYDTPTDKMDAQQEVFYEALRNPFERACKVASDFVQAAIAAIAGVLPELGWTPTGA